MHEGGRERFVGEVLTRENVLDGGCAREGRDAGEVEVSD